MTFVDLFVIAVRKEIESVKDPDRGKCNPVDWNRLVRHATRSPRTGLRHPSPTYWRYTMIRLSSVCVAILFVLMTLSSGAQEKNGIVGIWLLESQKVDGQDVLGSSRDVKHISSHHFAWTNQDKEKSMSLFARKTPHDSLAAFRDLQAFGEGTCTFNGDIYTETIESFMDPQYIGMSFDFTVKVDGDHLYQSGKYPILRDGKKVKEVMLEEVYRRLE